MRLDRRDLLKELSLLMAGLAACRRPPEATLDAEPRPDASSAASGWREGDHALAPPQRAALAAALARILPTDQDPGAVEANVIEYVDRELARPDLGNVRTAVIAGIIALNNVAKRGGGKPFVGLDAEEQDNVLHQIQLGSDRGKDFVFVLTTLTLEGFLGDPRWGGNAGTVGWKLIGYGPGEGGHEH